MNHHSVDCLGCGSRILLNQQHCPSCELPHSGCGVTDQTNLLAIAKEEAVKMTAENGRQTTIPFRVGRKVEYLRMKSSGESIELMLKDLRLKIDLSAHEQASPPKRSTGAVARIGRNELRTSLSVEEAVTSLLDSIVESPRLHWTTHIDRKDTLRELHYFLSGKATVAYVKFCHCNAVPRGGPERLCVSVSTLEYEGRIHAEMAAQMMRLGQIDDSKECGFTHGKLVLNRDFDRTNKFGDGSELDILEKCSPKSAEYITELLRDEIEKWQLS